MKKIYETIQPYCHKCSLSLHHFFPFSFIFATSIFHRLQYFISILFSSVLHKSTDKPHSFDFKWQQGLSKNSSNDIHIYLVNFLFTTAEGTSHVICHYYTMKIHFIIFFPKSQLYIHEPSAHLLAAFSLLYFFFFTYWVHIRWTMRPT